MESEMPMLPQYSKWTSRKSEVGVGSIIMNMLSYDYCL
jgi:hypothetical protein